MNSVIFKYPVTILETYLDVYGHVNNAMYMTLFEEARWDYITKNGYGFNKIMELGLGPVILGANLHFLKELRIREEVIIESQTVSYKQKIGKLMQTIKRKDEVCCEAEYTFGLFNIKTRKLVLPTPEWFAAIGWRGNGSTN